MSKMGDLFIKAQEASYPHAAGWRDPGTSKENAERIEASGKANTLREKVRAIFDQGRQMTADEIATFLNEPFRALQPRVSELRAQGYIIATGERRKGSGGGSANVWKRA